MRLAPCVLCVVACLLMARGGAHAQPAPNAHWQTLTTTHFRTTYSTGLAAVAQHAAASAERAHAALAVLVAAAPRGTIDIVVSDNIDVSNGSATAFPSNRILIHAKPPVDELELQYTRDWIELVVTHELAHIFHLDRSGAVGRLVRGVFGRVPAAWPVFSAYGSPRWTIEGLAVGVESGVTGFGRVHGSYNEMVVRTAALEGELDDIDRLTSGSPLWPGPARAYIYGSLFMDYLTRRFGDDVTARLVRNTAGAIIPPPLWFGRVAHNTFGMSFRDAYEAWQAELRTRVAGEAQALTAAGLTRTVQLTSHGGSALYPRFSPDGSRIAYAANDFRSPAATRVIDATSGARIRSDVRSTLAPSAWIDDTDLLTTDLEFTDPFHIPGDVRRVGGARLTRGERLHEIDVARGRASAVAVEVDAGASRVVLMDLAARRHRPITALHPDTQWSLPRFAPDGGRIAVGRWLRGGESDIVVLDTLGRVLQRIEPGPGVAAAPAWSADGRWLVFSSDRTGIPNLYAADVATGALRQVTNVLTGAFYPDVSPDGRTLVFAAYHHDGFRIERMPFDPSQWRDPMPAALTGLAHARGTTSAATLHDSMRVAFAAADTAVATTGGYRALRHARPRFWLPVLERAATEDFYIGALSYGRDLVGRHLWDLSFSIDPSSGRTRTSGGYTYRGLPSLPLDVHPALSLAFDRDWETALERDSVGGLYVDEREDAVAAGVSLTRSRWRSGAGLSLSGELVRRARKLHDAPPNLQLRDTDDRLLGGRVTAFVSRYHVPTFAVSREDGFTLQLGARRLTDRDPVTHVIDGNNVLFDASYDELTTWDAAYLALPLPGFARHVLAARFSALYRTGPGAAPSSIGGPSASGIGAVTLLGDIGGASRFLPIRGVDAGERYGTRAWTASAEYRFPIAFLTRSLRPLPIFLDRLSGAAFTDAGHAWCPPALNAGCEFDSPRATILATAGAELTSHLSAWGLALPLRFGFALPLQGTDTRGRLFLLAGSSF